MKKILLNFTRTIVALTALGLMAPLALAWTPPSGGFPQGNVPAPVNTGTITQTRNSTLNIVGNLNASIATIAGVVAKGTRGMFGCSTTNQGCLGIIPAGLFEAGKYLANNSSASLKNGISINTDGTTNIGAFPNSAITQGIIAAVDGSVSIGKVVPGGLPTQGLFIGNALGQAMSVFFGKVGISLSGTGPTGRNAIEVSVSPDNQTNGDGAVFQTNADRFSFYNAGSLAAISAKKIRLTEGAGQGKVLTSDADGNASWGNTVNAAIVDMIEVHVAGNGQESQTAYCPSHHPIAISGGGGCSFGMLSKVNVNYLGNDGSQGQVTVRCRQQDGNVKVAGDVDGVDLVCAKAVVGGIYGGVSSAGTIQNSSWSWVSNSVGGLNESCDTWLAGVQPTATDAQAYVNIGNANPLPNLPSGNGSAHTCAYEYDVEPVAANGSHSKCTIASKSVGVPGARPISYCSDSTSQIVMGNALSSVFLLEAKTAVFKP